MTIKGCIVSFDHDMKEQDFEVFANAIKLLRGVVGVKPVEVDSNDWILRARLQREVYAKIIDSLKAIVNE